MGQLPRGTHDFRRYGRGLIATQVSLYLLLKATLYEWHHGRGELPALSGDTRSASQAATDQMTDPAFGEWGLDDVIYLVDVRDRDMVVDEGAWLLESTQPVEDVVYLYEAVVLRALVNRHIASDLAGERVLWLS